MTTPLVYSVNSNVQLNLYTTSGTTNAAGAVTVPLPPGMFSVVYAAFAVAVRDTTDPALACFALVRSYSATSVVVQVFESAGTTMRANAYFEGLTPATTATTVLLTVFGM